MYYLINIENRGLNAPLNINLQHCIDGGFSGQKIKQRERFMDA